jgi:hypothetical protein
VAPWEGWESEANFVGGRTWDGFSYMRFRGDSWLSLDGAGLAFLSFVFSCRRLGTCGCRLLGTGCRHRSGHGGLDTFFSLPPVTCCYALDAFSPPFLYVALWQKVAASALVNALNDAMGPVRLDRII